ncbi:queuosine salvage family protein [Haloplanus ruber]|uniref:Queuosine 5'-phosphate N-glycosylase/hydrolase n=1 Tax=Haloplanus ruber TaxID=869892 RepID=A0ABD6D4L3_9EURY
MDIQEGAIELLSERLAADEFSLPEWRAPVFPDENSSGVSERDIIDFLFLGNTINFQFRDYDTGDKFTATYAGTEWSGAFAMWACLRREFDDNPAILRGDTLSDLSLSDVERLFEPADGDEIPMLEERHQILTQVGENLSNQYDGRFANLIDSAEPCLYADGNGIVDRLVTHLPSFDDSSAVTLADGSALEVAFWKRAQLAAGMAYGRFQNQECFRVEDPGAFTLFVDYNLPNVLRELGVLEYSDHLAELVDSRTMIEAGSREEVELRAATVHAGDELIEKLMDCRDSSVYAPHLDYKLFQMRDEIDGTIHITRTTAY